MNLIFSRLAWEQYLYWQLSDRQMLKKINALIKSIESDGLLKGEGKPEILRYRKDYSRRISDEHRLVYTLRDSNLYILSCRGHYQD